MLMHKALMYLLGFFALIIVLGVAQGVTMNMLHPRADPYDDLATRKINACYQHYQRFGQPRTEADRDALLTWCAQTTTASTVKGN